jgi:hypothetical protein
MNPPNYAILEGVFGSIFVIIIYLALIFAFVILLRWLFRLNEIAGYLKRIADKISPIETKIEKEISMNCDCCHKPFKPVELTELAIGKIVCDGCKNFIKSNGRT